MSDAQTLGILEALGRRVENLEILESVQSSADLDFAVPALTLGLANAEGAADFVIRSDATILAFDAVVPTTINVGDIAATGAAVVTARRDHLHGIVTSSNPGAKVAILASDANGYLQLVRIGLGIAPAVSVHSYVDDASTVPALRITQDGVGDAAIRLNLVGGQSWSLGLDNSVNDAFIIAAGAALQTNPFFTILVGGRAGFNVVAPTGQVHIDQSNNAAAIPVLKLDQADNSEGFEDYVGASAASAVGPISTWKSGAILAGFRRIEINGVAQWVAFYSAPTGP